MTTNITKCPNWTKCHKVTMLLDKNFDDKDLYHQVMESICAKCEDKK
jgi:hypothetical protein